MAEKLALDLPVLLPDALDGGDGCVGRLIATLDAQPGLDEVHVVDASATGPARLCLHVDPAVADLETIRRAAHDAGAELTGRYDHVVWRVRRTLTARQVRALERRLRSVPGVVELAVTTRAVRAEVDTGAGSVAALRAAAGNVLEPEPASGLHGPLGADARDHGHSHDHDSDRVDDHHGCGGHDHATSRVELGCTLAAGALWLAAVVAGLVADLARWVLTSAFVVVVVVAGWFTVREAWHKMRDRQVEIDALMLAAGAGAALLGQWREAALLLVLFGLGHALEGYALGRARSAVHALAELTPDTAILRDGERVVAVDELVPGDVIIVRPNARIAADGIVVAGSSTVDEAALTGESVPVDKAPLPGAATAAARAAIPASARVFAGTMNGSGRLDVRVARRAGESALATVAALVRDAETGPSPTQRFTERFQRIFVPAVLVVVIGTFVVGVVRGWGAGDALYRALAVLVAASPCALALAIPSAVLAAVARAARGGVLVKGGAALQHLGSVRAVAFDKTGTLTSGRPRLVDVVPSPGVDRADLLRAAVALERHSDHPLAAAIVRDVDVETGASVEATAVAAIAGRGVVGTVDGQRLTVGSPAMFADRDGFDASARAMATRLERAGRTVVVVERDGQVLGALGLLDTPRPGADDAVAALRELGVRHTVMLSGDHQAAAEAVAREVGVDVARGGLLPSDKAVAIDRLRVNQGAVAMIGDGVNDAPALARASVGIAMGAAGSDVALETADVALMGDDLRALPFAFGLGRRASRVIRQNLIASLSIVAVLLVATVTGRAGIGPAVVLHEGSTVLVVANALRLLAFRAPASFPRR